MNFIKKVILLWCVYLNKNWELLKEKGLFIIYDFFLLDGYVMLIGLFWKFVDFVVMNEDVKLGIVWSIIIFFFVWKFLLCELG